MQSKCIELKNIEIKDSPEKIRTLNDIVTTETMPSTGIEQRSRNRSRSEYTTLKYDINNIYFEEDKDIIVNLSKNQRKTSDYSIEENLAYKSREDILNWCEECLSSISLTKKEKESIFHRFSTAFDLVLEKMSILNNKITTIDDLKIYVITIFLVTYKFEGFSIGKITIKTLIEEFIGNMDKPEDELKTEIAEKELQILSLLDYNPMLLDNNCFQISFIYFDLMKRNIFKDLSDDDSTKFENALIKSNRIIQFSNKFIFDTLPLDKAALSIFTVLLYCEKKNILRSIKNISCKKFSFFYYLKDGIKVIKISEIDFWKFCNEFYLVLVKEI